MRKYRTKLFIFTLLFSIILTFRVGAEDLKEDIRSQNACNMLHALGMPENSHGAEDEITRGEFVVMLMSTLGFDVSDNATTRQIFLDVKPEHEAASAIYHANSMNFISGVDESHFYPDKKISFEEAVKIIVTVMGYGDLAQYKGGYPTGYVAIADSADILTNQRGNNYQNLCRIWANALTEPLHSNIGISENGLASYEKTDETLLFRYREIKVGEGVYYANEFTTLYGSGDLGENCVEIEDEVYTDSYGIDSKLLGQNLIYLYNEKELIFAYPESVKRKTISVDAQDIISYKDGTLTYNVGESQKTARIIETPYVFCNGVGYSDYSDTDFCPVHGELELIDEEGDGKYEIVFIKRADILVVEEISKDNLKIVEKYSGDILDLSKDGTKYSLVVDGEVAELSTLSANTVLSVYASHDKKVFEIVGSTKLVHGKISGVRYDDNNSLRGYAQIGEEEYEIWQDAIDKAYPGADGKWFLSAEGIIAEYEGFSEYRFGYLCRKFHQDTPEEVYQLQIVTNTGKTVKYNLRKKVLYNYTQRFSAEEIYNMITNPQLVMFKANGNLEITALQTVTNNLSGQYGYDEEILTFDEELDSAVFYKRMLKNILMTKQTPIFRCPDVKDGLWTEPEDVTVINISELENGETYNNIKVYSYNDMLEAGAVIMESVEKNYVDIESPVLVIDKVTRSLNLEESPAYKVFGYREGKYVSYAMTDNAHATSTENSAMVKPHNDGGEMRRGDIIQIELENDEICSWRTVYRTELGEKHGEYYNTSGAYKDFRAFECQMGDIYKSDSDTFLMKVNGNMKKYYFDSECYVYRYSGEKVRLEEISASEIGKSGRESAVFCISNRKAPRVIVEYIYN